MRSSTSVVLVFIMSADDLRRVHDSSDDRIRRRDNAWAIPFCQGRVADGVDIPGRCGLPPLCPPPSGKSVPALVSVTKYTSDFKSFLDSRRFACMLQDGEKFDFIDARFGGRHDTILGAWRKC